MWRLKVLAPKTVSGPLGTEGSYHPWVEVTALVRLSLPDWQLEQREFLHWACPWPASSPAQFLPFDVGRRAARAGTPPGLAGELKEEEAQQLAGEALGKLPRVIYRQRALGMVSQLGETLPAFRHRLLSVFGRVVREGLVRREPQAAAQVAEVLAGIESRPLREGELQVEEVRVGLAFYPEEAKPSLAPPGLMIEGGQGWQG